MNAEFNRNHKAEHVLYSGYEKKPAVFGFNSAGYTWRRLKAVTGIMLSIQWGPVTSRN